MPLTIASQIESLLFVRTEPTSIKWLADQLGVTKAAIAAGIQELEDTLSQENNQRGIVLVRHDESVMLATHPEMAHIIENLHKREIKSELSRAALETLAIIAYKKEITKHELDYIRGVNSQFMLRNLLVRGLIDKKDNNLDKRRPLYMLSADSLTFLGITQLEDLPDYDTLREGLDEIETSYNHYAEQGENQTTDTTLEE